MAMALPLSPAPASVTATGVCEAPDLRKFAVRNGQVFRRAANLPFEGSFPIWPRSIKFFAVEYLWWKNLDVTYR